MYMMCRVVCQNDQQTLQPSTAVSSPGHSAAAVDSTISRSSLLLGLIAPDVLS